MSEDKELKRELSELVTLVGHLSTNHAEALGRHEAHFASAFKAVSSHAEAIKDLRTSVSDLSELMGRQNEILNTLRQCVIKIQRVLAIDDTLPPSRSPLGARPPLARPSAAPPPPAAHRGPPGGWGAFSVPPYISPSLV